MITRLTGKTVKSWIEGILRKPKRFYKLGTQINQQSINMT